MQVVASPLLVARRARSSGGRGGTRVRVLLDAAGWTVRVEGAGAREARGLGDLQAVQAFNAALRAAARRGLTSVPPPVELGVERLHETRAALGA